MSSPFSPRPPCHTRRDSLTHPFVIFRGGLSANNAANKDPEERNSRQVNALGSLATVRSTPSVIDVFSASGAAIKLAKTQAFAVSIASCGSPTKRRGVTVAV